MAQRRMLSRRIGQSRKLSQVSLKSALLYTWMIPFLDDYGRFEAEPDTLKSEVVRYRREFTHKTIQICLEELERAGLVRLYEVDGIRYLELVKFEDFQSFRSDRARKAEYPSPPWDDNGMSDGIQMGYQWDTNGIPEGTQTVPSVIPKNKYKNKNKKEEGLYTVTEEEHRMGLHSTITEEVLPTTHSLEIPIPQRIIDHVQSEWGPSWWTPSFAEWVRRCLYNGASEELLLHALEETVRHGKRSRAYAEAVLRRMEEEGEEPSPFPVEIWDEEGRRVVDRWDEETWAERCRELDAEHYERTGKWRLKRKEEEWRNS